jgi:hypothetical protein
LLGQSDDDIRVILDIVILADAHRASVATPQAAAEGPKLPL